jgi:hypothetical protein
VGVASKLHVCAILHFTNDNGLLSRACRAVVTHTTNSNRERRLCCTCLGCQGFRGFRESKKGSSSGTEMEVAKMTVSSSGGPLLHLFLCLLSESCSIQQGEALDALLLSLQAQQRSLERSWGLDHTVV